MKLKKLLDIIPIQQEITLYLEDADDAYNILEEYMYTGNNDRFGDYIEYEVVLVFATKDLLWIGIRRF